VTFPRQKLLNAALDLDLVFSLERLARWIRASVTLLLANGAPPSAAKALEHIDEAIDVMRARPEATAYPQDEADWVRTALETNSAARGPQG
jgi:hypothetical protein